MFNDIEDLGLAGLKVADWDIRLSFPYKTLTTDYSTWTTYISRRPVPANTPITDIKYWKPILRLDRELFVDYQNYKEQVNAKVIGLANIIGSLQQQVNNLNTQMQSFLATASGGEAFASMYGNSEVMGVTQKTLTQTVNGLYQLIADTIGIYMGNVQIEITPDIFLKGHGDVNVSVLAEYGVLDFVKVYFDGVEQVNQTSVQFFSQNFTITDTTVIKVEASLFGTPYFLEKTVQISSDFFIGAGDNYTDVYKAENSRPYDGDPTGAYQVTVTEGQRIIIILPTADVASVEQIEMNDFNIPMSTDTFGDYTAYTSLNTYQAGTYQIDINY